MTEEILEETALAPSELIELFKHRSATYGLLSRLYAKEVDAELLDELHDTLWPVETGTDAGDTKATASSPPTSPAFGRTR